MGQERASVKPTALNPSENESESAVQRVMSSFVEDLSRRLAGLCDATGLCADAAKTADDVLRDLIVPWSRVEAFARAPGSGWISEISDDNTPIEFSVTISPTGSEVRVLFEPQGEEQTLAGHRDAALRMHEQLARQYAADLSRFRLVSDLFTPSGMQGPFALWSAVVFANDKPPSFKSYFNPQAQGVGSAVALVEEALRRLGLPRAWRHLASTMARRGPHRDELKYFALDLSTSEQARVKVYVRHHEATPEDLEIAASAASDSTRGEAQDFARAMGGRALRFKERATFTCAAFVGGQDDRPSATTQYVPVCAYALDDLEVERRVASYLGSQGIDDAPYRRMLAAFANRPLDAGVGLQSWVAFRRYRGVPRLTVYLGTETRCVFPPGSVPAGTRDHMLFDSPSQILSCVAQYSLSEHPLLRAVSRLSQRREVLWLLVSNASALLTNTTELSLANLDRWLSDNAALGSSLPVAYEPYRNLFTEALSLFEESPEAVDAIAARSTAANAARALAKTLAEFLESEETSSIGLSLDSILREGSAADTERLSRLDAAGVAALPAMVRGALAVHEKLWSALDQLSNLASDGDPET